MTLPADISAAACPRKRAIGHGQRERVSPTSRKLISVLVDTCYGCGFHTPVHPERLTWRERHWLDRWNLRAAYRGDGYHSTANYSDSTSTASARLW